MLGTQQRMLGKASHQGRCCASRAARRCLLRGRLAARSRRSRTCEVRVVGSFGGHTQRSKQRDLRHLPGDSQSYGDPRPRRDQCQGFLVSPVNRRWCSKSGIFQEIKISYNMWLSSVKYGEYAAGIFLRKIMSKFFIAPIAWKWSSAGEIFNRNQNLRKKVSTSFNCTQSTFACRY